MMPSCIASDQSGNAFMPEQNVRHAQSFLFPEGFAARYFYGFAQP